MRGRAVCFGLERQDVIGRWVCGDLEAGRLFHLVLRCRENCPASGPTFGGMAGPAYQRFEPTVALLHQPRRTQCGGEARYRLGSAIGE
jgi:hypothetical protein